MNSKIRLAISVLAVFTAFSFGNTLEDLELFVLKSKSSLPTVQQLESFDFSKIGGKINDRKDFEKKYESYLARIIHKDTLKIDNSIYSAI